MVNSADVFRTIWIKCVEWGWTWQDFLKSNAFTAKSFFFFISLVVHNFRPLWFTFHFSFFLFFYLCVFSVCPTYRLCIAVCHSEISEGEEVCGTPLWSHRVSKILNTYSQQRTKDAKDILAPTMWKFVPSCDVRMLNRCGRNVGKKKLARSLGNVRKRWEF